MVNTIQKGNGNVHNIKVIDRKLIPGTHFYTIKIGISDKNYTFTMIPSVFQITQDNLNQFISTVDSQLTPMDCFINALQLLNIFDKYTSNVLRITCVGKQGVSESQVEQIFTLWHVMHYARTGYFDFLELGNFDLWSPVVTRALKNPGDVIFAGWRQQSGGHVFIIAKDLGGNILYIDPQINTSCSLNNIENNSRTFCINSLRQGETPDRSYFILYRSEEEILSQEIIKGMGFDLNPGRGTGEASAFRRQ